MGIFLFKNDLGNQVLLSLSHLPKTSMNTDRQDFYCVTGHVEFQNERIQRLLEVTDRQTTDVYNFQKLCFSCPQQNVGQI